ncbi:MAG: hypothetical protein IT495_04970 [Gammaproteobacteria bacterium]|nr:hypothetical protein [Gammaproteobacteria bacterium]
MRTRPVLGAALAALLLAPAHAEDGDGGPIRLDLGRATRNENGSYTLPSFLHETPDGGLEFSNGKRLSKKEAVQKLIDGGNARGPDGRPISPGEVTVGDDGVVTTRDGKAINGPQARAEGGAQPVVNVRSGAATATAPGENEADDESAQEQRGAVAAPVDRNLPRSAVGTIELISGGKGRDGVAAVEAIPVLD